jgi:hypothetical protein
VATQQAWDDFLGLKGLVEFIEGDLGVNLKNSFIQMDALFNAIVADPVRAAEAIALADLHPEWTSAALLARVTAYQGLRDYLGAQGFIV